MGQFNPMVHGPRAAPEAETHEVRLLRGLARNLSALLDLKNLALETARKDDWHVCTRLSYVAGDPCLACDAARTETDLEIAQSDLRQIAAILTEAGIPEMNGDATIAAPYRVRMLAERAARPAAP